MVQQSLNTFSLSTNTVTLSSHRTGCLPNFRRNSRLFPNFFLVVTEYLSVQLLPEHFGLWTVQECELDELFLSRQDNQISTQHLLPFFVWMFLLDICQRRLLHHKSKLVSKLHNSIRRKLCFDSRQVTGLRIVWLVGSGRIWCQLFAGCFVVVG